jgi:hypothetical protein
LEDETLLLFYIVTTVGKYESKKLGVKGERRKIVFDKISYEICL